MSRSRARKLIFYMLVSLICAICVIFLIEWSYIEKLKDVHESELPVPRSRNPEISINVEKHDIDLVGVDEGRTPCPVLDDNVGWNDIYKTLKKRKQYELRREKTTRELWWYIRNRLNHMETDQNHAYLNVTLNSVRHHYTSLRLRNDEVNGISSDSEPFQFNWKYWQKNISSDLTLLMKKRIEYLQNPSDCKSAKKLVCHVAKACGFGCQIHHVSYCFIIAYATKRTLIIDSSNWRYSPKGWDAVFQPLSTTCTQVPSDIHHFDLTSQALTVSLPPVDSLSPRPAQLPLAIPRDLSDRLMSFHGLPFAWFVAQFLKYLMRPSSDLKAYLNEKKTALGIGNEKILPIVGLHVRRTDKRSEARYHEINEYMTHVEEWYDWYQLTHAIESTDLQRRVFIATDEPSVVTDARTRYPVYEFFSDSGISSLASKIDTRYSTDSLFGLIFDVTMLSECDYIVCTFSSQVCRLAYELIQNHHIDASKSYFSLDDIYYFGGQQAHDVVAIEDHEPIPNSGHSEIPFHVGDHLGIAGNEKNGYSVGIHRDTHIRGDFPSYKVEDHVLIEDFPVYEEVTVNGKT